VEAVEPGRSEQVLVQVPSGGVSEGMAWCCVHGAASARVRL
jgi:hypothetical protein